MNNLAAQREDHSFGIDRSFEIKTALRLRRFIDGLRDVATTLGSTAPDPRYLGRGLFEVRWPGQGRLELKDTSFGALQLRSSPLSQMQLEAVKQAFEWCWNEAAEASSAPSRFA